MSTVDKMNPIKYLEKAFNDPEKLLYEMGKFNMILCGSRALDYFIEGSARPSSNWNFYCDNTKTSIYGSMKALEKAGVVWYDLALAGAVAASEFKRRAAANDIPPYARYLEKYIDMPEKKWNSMDKDELYRIAAELRYSGSYDSYAVGKIVGHTTQNGYRHHIELKFSLKDKTVMQLLMDFNLSILQCFIGFSGAGHLYYNTTIDKISYYWIDSRYDGKDPIIPKYQKKGFKLITYHDKQEIKPELVNKMAYETLVNKYSNSEILSAYNNVSSIRFLSDDKSKFIDFGKYYNINRINDFMNLDGHFLVKDAQFSSSQIIYALSQIKLSTIWYQLPWKPVLVSSIVESMDSQLHIGFHNYNQISNSMLDAGERSVFMNACIAKKIKFVYPDSLYDKDLLKHVRHTLQYYGVME